MFNFAPAVPLEKIANACQSEGRGQHELFELTDFLILNEVEVQELSESPVSKENVVEDAKKASRTLLAKFKIQKGVIVTLGELGVLFTPSSKPDHSVHVQGRKAVVVDTAVRFTQTALFSACAKAGFVVLKGAGDAFVGSFSHFLSKLGESSMETVLDLASSYASLTVEAFGTQTSYPSLDKLEKKFHC